jgi:hypothetical protein
MKPVWGLWVKVRGGLQLSASTIAADAPGSGPRRLISADGTLFQKPDGSSNRLHRRRRALRTLIVPPGLGLVPAVAHAAPPPAGAKPIDEKPSTTLTWRLPYPQSLRASQKVERGEKSIAQDPVDPIFSKASRQGRTSLAARPGSPSGEEAGRGKAGRAA